MNRENIEEILNKLGKEDVPADVHKIAQETSEQFSKTLIPPRQHILWQHIVESGITKLAVAATIFITFGIGFSFGRWSKPTPPPHSLDVTSLTSTVSVYPAANKTEDSFWRQKALAAMQPRPYPKTHITKTSLIDAYKQYLKEKHYD